MKANKKIALVTGGTSGIGFEIAKKLKSEGFKVIITGKSKKLNEKNYYNVDFSSTDQINNFINEISSQNIDILVNNAGINKIAKFSEITMNDFIMIHKVNCAAPLSIIQAVLPGMINRKWGRILNVCSIWSYISKAGRASYSASKFGLDGITAALAAEVANNNVLVNSISPGFTDTPLTTQTLSGKERQKIKSTIPIGRFAAPAEIAEFASWLVSDKNTYISGQNLIIDGGFVRV